MTMLCSHCQAEKTTKTDRLPPGWKRFRDMTWCEACWGKSYILRAVTIPVVGPLDGEWADLRTALKACWASATTVANWAVTEMARNDTPRVTGAERLAKAPKLYLYPGARQAAPECNPQSVTAVLHAVEKRYRAKRLATLWQRSESFPLYRYPVPYPVHNQGWSAVHGPHEEPCISVRLGDRRWSLRLRGGAEFRRQLKVWRQIKDGEALQGELALIGQLVTDSDHRNGIVQRDAGGGPRKTTRIMAKMVAWVPRHGPQAMEGILHVKTSHPAFIVYHVGTNGEPKHVHAEHVKRWEAQHRRRLQNMADDLKHEKRWPAETRRNMLAAQDRWCKKYRDRMSTFCHEVSAVITGFATRQHVATVSLDTTDRSFCERFPWHELIEKCRYKLDAVGIALEVINK